MEINDDLHRELGKRLNGEVWKLLGKTDRTPDETRRMIHAAHASHYHWLAGGPVHEQRGEWLISHVYAALGLGEAALRHAERCAELTEQHEQDLRDFDVAYAAEAQARAHAVLGHRSEAAALRAKARRLGDGIADPEDKKIFDGDFEGGDWHGVA